MARIRSIKPEIAQDAKLARLSRETRYHFVLCWTQADDEGYLRASPRLLLGLLYPHDRDIGEAVVDRMGAELVEAGLLELRGTEDGPIAKVRNWAKHQKIDHPSRSHLAPLFSTGSRESRESGATGVLSLDLGPDNTVLRTGDEPRTVEPRPEVPPPEDSEKLGRAERQAAIGRLMGVVRASAYLGKPPRGYDDARDVSILRGWLKTGRTEHEIRDAIEGLRTAVDTGTVEWANAETGGLRPGQAFTLRALRNTKSGDRFTWDVAQDTALRRPSGPMPELLGGVLRKAISA
jgi:hypothetical protein